MSSNPHEPKALLPWEPRSAPPYVRVAVFGAGYVGGVTAVALASIGHEVVCVDVDNTKVAAFSEGNPPFHEPGLKKLLRTALKRNRISFRTAPPPTLAAEIAFVAVGTPSAFDGAADLTAVRETVRTLARCLCPGAVVALKSTVPVGTTDMLRSMVLQESQGTVELVSNPEFQREGSAVEDFLHPSRVVLGGSSSPALDALEELYAPLNAPIVRVDARSAEMIKYASNAFLATKISFINEISAICEGTGADVQAVARGMGLDPRIGNDFLSAGLGWGGSCFPKDVQALIHLASVHGAHPQLLRAVEDINRSQRLRVVHRLRNVLGGLADRRIAVLGASFKPGTDDLRASPALALSQALLQAGARVTVHDPVVPVGAILRAAPGVAATRSASRAVEGTDAVVVATDWPHFARLDFRRLAELSRQPLLIDCRNYLDEATVRAAGFTYLCIGRPTVEGDPTQSDRAVVGQHAPDGHLAS